MIYPEYIDSKEFEFVKIENKYISTFMVIKYPKQLTFLHDILPDNLKYINAIILKKQDTYKTLKEISYNLSASKANIKDIGYNRIDYDVVDKYNNDMTNLRKDIQINLEEVYNVYNCISLFGNSKQELKEKQNFLKSKLYAKDFNSINLNFRQLEGYLSTTFANFLSENITNYYKLLTTSNLISMFPFVTKNIIDEKGVLIGKSAFSEIVVLDMFKENYLNSNMCIFGSSGTGKSFFTKLLILRNYVNDINGYIFDIEGEYVNVTNKCNGVNINIASSTSYINLLEIDKYDVLQLNYLDFKCENIFNYLILLIDSLKDKEVFLNSKVYIIDSLKQLYDKYNINENVNSVYDDNKYYIEKRLKSSNNQPNLVDLLDIINNKKINEIIRKITINYSIFCNKSNINIYGDLINFNLKGLNNTKIEKIAILLFNIIEKKIKYKENKTLIYIDEFWKMISYSDVLEQKVLELFKTIRKNNAGIVAITQDMGDVFLKTSNIGRAIINNSCFLMFFKMEYADKEDFIKSGMGFDNVLDGIQTLNKGCCILKLNSNIVKLDVIATKKEMEIIKEECYDNNSNR